MEQRLETRKLYQVGHIGSVARFTGVERGPAEDEQGSVCLRVEHNPRVSTVQARLAVRKGKLGAARAQGRKR